MTTSIIGIATESTCAANCWYAREEECRCSCGGRNHGCLLTDGAEQPRRNCKIQGVRYVLGAVGFGMSRKSREFRDLLNTLDRDLYGRHIGTHVFYPSENEPRSTVWVKSASVDQCAKWPEVAAAVAQYPEQFTRGRRPYLLWVREDVAEIFDGMAD